MKIITTLLLLSTLSFCEASRDYIVPASQCDIQFKDNTSTYRVQASLKADGSLDKLILIWNEKTFEISREEFSDIQNPKLNTIQILSGKYRSESKVTPYCYIKLEDIPPNKPMKQAMFIFSNGDYEMRRTREKVTEDEWIWSIKLPKEKEHQSGVEATLEK